MKIIQVLDYFTSGNAVANCAVMYYQMTLKLGIESAVVSRLCDKKKCFVKDCSYLEHIKEDDIVMYHMCIGTPLNESICHYPCRKVLVYHNITPPQMLASYEPVIANACREGLKQLLYMKNYFDVCLAMSEFNKQDLIRYGYPKERITVMPPYRIVEEQYQKEPDKKTLKQYGDGWVNIVFVGRISPNKKQEDLIRIFQYFKTNIHKQSRLILAGGGEGTYYDKLLEYTENLNVKDVIFTHQIPFSQLLAIYRTATVFLCASAHEGFGIPLVEAMYFDIPVIAYDNAAIGDTLNGAGILLKDKNPVLAAKIIERVCTDSAFRMRLVQRQRETVQTLTEEAVFQNYKKWIDALPQLLQKEKQINVCPDPSANPYDVVMVIKAADWELAKRNLKYIKKYLNPKQIKIIASHKIGKLSQPDHTVRFIDEDQLYEGLTLEHVKKILIERQIGISSAGWYFQQFLKLAYAYVCKDDYYLVWDADTIPLRNISMIDAETKKPYFDMKPEYISAYFTSIRNLTGMEKAETESFIAEHMLFRTKIVKQMLAYIEKNASVGGISFFEKIINTLDTVQERTLSEFELYGTYCQYVYPDLYRKRHLRTMRCGKMFLGPQPKQEVLKWVGKTMDTVSFEHPQSVIPQSVKLSESEKFRKKHSVFDLMQRVFVADCLTGSEWLQKEKEALRMDEPWARQPVYLQSEDFRIKMKEQKANGNVKIMIYGSSENAYLCGLIFARRGMQVLFIDKTYNREKIKHFHTYWGFHAFFDRVYGDTLHITTKMPRKIHADFLFFSSSQLQQSMPFDAKPKSTGILLDCQKEEPFSEKQVYSGVDVLINTVLWKKEALLYSGKDSVTELWEDKTAEHTAAALFSGQMKVKAFEDKDDFLNHVRLQADYLAELQVLQDKYGDIL
uniref:Glycosyl transferase family 1 domain-containing protein n=1 Tax=Eubacterium plexicaudatum ASF492 TaxID=1235802 RepID=N2B612_9FIRM